MFVALEDCVGKTIIIGLTYLHSDGSLDRQVQLHGVVEEAGPQGVLVRLSTGEQFNLPPAPDGFERASPGEYRFRSTGEVVVNPDLMSTWTITEPTKH